MRKFLMASILVLVLASSSYADKWKTMIFKEDISLGIAELEQYCILHDIKVEDVLWANSISSSSDITAGQSIYLPANQADMLGIWQNKGAWKPTALVPVTSAAAAKRAVTPEAPKAVQQPEVIPEVKTSSAPKDQYAEDLAKLMESIGKSEPKTASQPQQPALNTASLPVKTEQPAPLKTASLPTPKAVQKNETPAKVMIESTTKAKPDKILADAKKKSEPSNQIPGLMDPIIILSPNGDATSGPMRLVISGDKVEVVRLPQNALPKKPSMSDLDYSFTGASGYYPYYNTATRKNNNNYILNNLNALNGKMLWPVDGKVSSPFGWRGRRKHEGIDIPMPHNTPIRAAKNGVVSRTGNNSTMGFRGYGNFVLLDHGGGIQTFYAHCASVAVAQGQRVMQGQIIGYVGNTGRSTANHLHFEVRVNNTKVNPMPYLAGNSRLASHK